MSLSSTIDRIDAVLPQTQCTKCGFDGCRPYAQAIAEGRAAINRCPPGGADGIRALATLLGVPELSLDTSCGEHAPPRLAVIDEAHCIGCTLCIQACPVDAIVGANKLMHTVIPDLCTGCELCVAPCPVDCISMAPDPHAWTPERADAARARHQHRRQRLDTLHHEDASLAARTLANKAPVALAAADNPDARHAAIARALERARQRRQNHE
ncbi:electron transport complex subunit RsxB [Pusillimonas sp. TS35]|uniref:electron transport complex subunit RsxB n=1 Tax=Paracandidimonas lactea TaxID=2895524 RepID=UPI00136C3D6E|nr:electron transport complex subunit RsxB [Paracandidimonas lactea]MYN13677.1 electron transport complex subunit RsxB [Pusillimonas sp. TS35]